MTTIKSAFGKKLRVTDYDDGKLALTCAPDNDGSSDHVRVYDRAELLDALGAVPKGSAWGELVHLARERDAATQRAEAAEATIQRVREVLAKHRERGGNKDLNMGARLAYQQAATDLARALDPVPPFTLPTEAGARFTATRTGIEYTFQTVTYRIPDGGMTLYIREGDLVGLTAKEVMADFTDHRLLGAEDA